MTPPGERTVFPAVAKWEEQVFRDALYFVVIRFMDKPRPTERKVFTFTEFPAAVRAARAGPRAVIYAVDKEKNDVCFERPKWSHYLKMWREMNRPAQGASP